MSEYETTDLGGDPVEFEFVEGGTYERGVIRSTADRQQIRRDAEAWQARKTVAVEAGRIPDADTLARHCLALLTELEQAEQQISHLAKTNDSFQEGIEQADHLLEMSARKHSDLESRLANVPALVEALKWIEDPFHVHNYDDVQTIETYRQRAYAALAAWDKQ